MTRAGMDDEARRLVDHDDVVVHVDDADSTSGSGRGSAVPARVPPSIRGCVPASSRALASHGASVDEHRARFHQFSDLAAATSP